MVPQSVAYHRIVSLTPSLTEILFALGLGRSVVGVTDACDYPSEARQKPHVHSWFDPDLDRICDLGPDLILGLETAHLHLKTLVEKKCETVPFVLTAPNSVDQALGDIALLGHLLGVPERAQCLLTDLQERLARLDHHVQSVSPDRRPTVSRVLEWAEDRLIVAGPLSFQYDVITRAGGRNVTGMLPEAYPKVSLSQFQVWDPEVVFFCGVGSRFIAHLRQHPRWRSFRCAREGGVHAFDCGLTCRTGPRIVDMVELLHRTLYGNRGT